MSSQMIDDLPERQYLTGNPSPKLAISKITSIVGLILFSLATVIPILQFYIGRRYVNECPLDWHIPHYLIVAGILGIVLAIFGLIQNALALKIASNPSRAGSGVVLFGLTCFISILLLFLLAWFVAGCFWVFRSWHLVQYDDPDHTDFCHPILYRFTYWILLLTLIFKLVSCFFSSTRLSSQWKELKKSNPSAS